MLDENRRVCTRCVMDTTDWSITFDHYGVCNHCHQFDNVTSKNWFPDDNGKKNLENLVNKIRQKGSKQEYDCILGLSGGVDSSYLALVLKEYGLRPLVVHVDAGWNSELAVYNIEQIVKYCGYELHTHVLNWEEIKDLQLSYLKASLSNQDVIQDHAFFASLYSFAVQNNIKYVFNGGNIATESVFPSCWHHAAMDSINLKAIHKRYGKQKLKDYRTLSFFEYYFYYPFIRGLSVIRPLNFMPYNKKNATSILKERVGYKEYGRKHGESRFTKFFQNYYLPEKFNMDKRKAHLSSQILSGEISRSEALNALSEPLYEKKELEDDKSFVAKKLGISKEALERLVMAPNGHYSQYANWDSRYKMMVRTKLIIEKISGKKIKTY